MVKLGAIEFKDMSDIVGYTHSMSIVGGVMLYKTSHLLLDVETGRLVLKVEQNNCRQTPIEPSLLLTWPVDL